MKIQAEAIRTMLGTYFFDKGRISKKQENALEKLIEATYNAKGIFQNDENSWNLQVPTMQDFYKVFKYVLSFNDGDSSGKSNLSSDDYFNAIADELNNFVKIGESKEEATENISKLRMIQDFVKAHSKQKDIKECIEACVEDELSSDDLDYDSINIEALTDRSVFKTVENLFSYIENITQLSIFNGTAPKLKKGINRIDLSAFTSISKPMTAKFLSEFIAQKFFRACMLRGEYDKISSAPENTKFDRIMIFDESKLALPVGVAKEDPFNIFNRILTESRKYGLAVILASQRLNHYSEEILSNIHTKILLGAKSNDYKNAARVMATKEEVLRNTFSFNGKRTALIECGGKCESYEVTNLS